MRSLSNLQFAGVILLVLHVGSMWCLPCAFAQCTAGASFVDVPAGESSYVQLVGCTGGAVMTNWSWDVSTINDDSWTQSDEIAENIRTLL
jgi:hypothetical protein